MFSLVHDMTFTLTGIVYFSESDSGHLCFRLVVFKFTMETHGLFGDAFECLLPINVIDASAMRQIPDNQEVFVHPSTNQSICVDILEYVNADSVEHAARMHFEEIGSANETTEMSVDSVRIIPPPYADLHCSAVAYLTGRQVVRKFNQNVDDAIRIHLALYRYEAHQADVLVLVNDPVADNYETQLNGTTRNGSVLIGGPSPPESWTSTAINAILSSLRLKNPEIFNS
ncbi:Ran guanine nucleotide release factor [Fasciola gigantica]|uniref:Ran guanine nucleotide release factor n=1 Tax=Fasciola gigantica TaxID=46835 RepID=A0A504YLU4_FASGI|nr:Ran guanine nucleotide release factor [Fasciola gigantica]